MMRYLTIIMLITLSLFLMGFILAEETNSNDTTLKETESSTNQLNYCPSCGVKLEEGYKYCPNCGFKLPVIEEKPVEKFTYRRNFLQITPTIGMKNISNDYLEGLFTYGGNIFINLQYFTVDLFFNYITFDYDFLYYDDESKDLYTTLIKSRIPISIAEYFSIGPAAGIQYDKYCYTSPYSGYETFSDIGVRGEFFANLKLDMQTQKILFSPAFYIQPTWDLYDYDDEYEHDTYSTIMGFETLIKWRFYEYVGLLFRFDISKFVFEDYEYYYSSPTRTLLLIGPVLYPF